MLRNMKRIKWLMAILAAIASILLIANVASKPWLKARAQPVIAHAEFINPEPIVIQGYSGPQQDPTISPDGLYLFFDSHNDDGQTTYLYWAQRIDYKTFKFMGEVQGVNFPGAMTLRGNYDLAHNFYFVSLKFRNSCGMITQGIFNKGSVTNIKPVRGICAPSPPPGYMNVTFDVAISPDGKTLYYSNAVVANSGRPESSRIAVASKNDDGSFTPLPKSDELFQSVNALASSVYNSAPTPDGLTFFFTPNIFPTGPAIYVVTRLSTLEPFGTPHPFAEANDNPNFASWSYSEMGGVSPDGNYLYFHRVLSKKSSQIYVLTRQR